MPIIKSAIKRAKQSEVRRLRNLKTKTAVKKDIRAVLDNPAGKDAAKALSQAYSDIDKAVKRGILHANTAARRKASLAKAIAGSSKPAAKTTAPKKTPAKKAQ